MTFNRRSKDEARARIAELVDRFSPLEAELTATLSAYTETEARTSYIDEFLIALGWDVRNEDGRSQVRTDVVMERTGSDEDRVWGRPDYRWRLDGQDCMPVEAKKPAVRLATAPGPAVQARSYGWSMSLPAAVLTNFAETAIYDTTIPPEEGDGPDVALIPGCRYRYDEYVSRFEELWERLSFESITAGGLERVYGYTQPPRGESPVDLRLLSESRRWRLTLAEDIAQNNKDLPAPEVGRRTQRLLNALLFLRVCEDRNIGRYRDLLNSANARTIVAHFKQADRVFNAGLFTVLDDTSISAGVLVSVIAEMYWPRSQFAFGVLQPEILAGLYEQYLAERVVLDGSRRARLEPKPELTHAGGVVPTPDYIVQRLNDAALGPLLEGGAPGNLAILDLSCGSGVFLVDAFKRVVAACEAAGETVGLAARSAIVTKHLFGVDIDGAAAEVTKLSLLLAVLGEAVIDPAVDRQSLPDLSRNIVVGNAVVREDFDRILPGAAAEAHRRSEAAPLDLRRALGSCYPKNGFSAVIGNPPYVRIQTLSAHMPDQLEYLQDPRSGYESPASNNFDLYQVFIERALDLLAKDGRLAYIVPHRFTNHLSGSAVRLRLGRRLERLVHFGEVQVFPHRTTYTALVTAGPSTSGDAIFELVSDLDAWRSGSQGQLVAVPRADLGPDIWPIATADQTRLMDSLEAHSVARLGDPEWVKIFVGVQTSADKLFFIKPRPGDPSQPLTTFLDVDGVERQIERALLRPAVLDRQIAFYDGEPEPDCQAIFPYVLEETGTKRGLRARPLTPEEMRIGYPSAFEYFEAHSTALRARSVSPDPGEAIWAYGRSQSLTQLDEPKLIVRVLSLTPLYAEDRDGLVAAGGGDGGPYYLLRPQPDCPYSIKVIQAILSHPVVDMYVAVNGKKYRGSYVSHRGAFLAKVPVPNLTAADGDQVEAHVTELQGIAVRLRREVDVAVTRSLKARRGHLAGEVESILSSAYRLDAVLVRRVLGTE